MTHSLSQGSSGASSCSVGVLAQLSAVVSADGSTSGELTTKQDFCSSSLNFQRCLVSSNAIATPSVS